MVAKSQLRLVKKLHQKKYRSENKLFFVEGIKMVEELLMTGLRPYLLLATQENLHLFSSQNKVEEISSEDLAKVSALKNPNGIMGIFYQPIKGPLYLTDWVVALDAVQDPGNLGTIIRLCDWFGIQHLVCSEGTVDCFNPKVLQATMGSIGRVSVHYLEMEAFLESAHCKVYGTFMDGYSVYKESLKEPGILLMGNEANGISPDLNKYISKRITIPQFGIESAESLNVAMAMGILLNEIRRC